MKFGLKGEMIMFIDDEAKLRAEWVVLSEEMCILASCFLVR